MFAYLLLLCYFPFFALSLQAFFPTFILMCDCDWPIMVNSNTGRLFILIKVILKATEINLPKLLTTLSNWVCWRPVWHDDVIKWKHFPRYWQFVWGIQRSPVNSPHKGQWRGALMFSLICAQINGWVNNREAGDLRRHQAHCDVILMSVTKTVIRPILHGHCYPSYRCGGPYDVGPCLNKDPLTKSYEKRHG